MPTTSGHLVLSLPPVLLPPLAPAKDELILGDESVNVVVSAWQREMVN
jgi:hypothetical protein